jgi:hypothetical protein
LVGVAKGLLLVLPHMKHIGGKAAMGTDSLSFYRFSDCLKCKIESKQLMTFIAHLPLNGQWVGVECIGRFQASTQRRKVDGRFSIGGNTALGSQKLGKVEHLVQQRLWQRPRDFPKFFSCSEHIDSSVKLHGTK